MSITANVYAKARSEIVALFGWNADSLSPDQTLRLDCAVALRLALDDLQGRIVRGESIDVNRMLTAAEALAKLLPAAVLASPPPEHRVDPRDVMWQTYLGMRRRGEIGNAQIEARESDRLRACVAELEAQLAGHPLAESVPPALAAPAPASAGNNVVKLSTPRAVDVNALPPAEVEPWRAFVNADGSIRSQPRGRWDV